MRQRRGSVAGRLRAFGLVLILAGMASQAVAAPEPSTDYERELAQIDAGLAGFKQKPPQSSEEFRRFIYFGYRRASLTGEPREIQSALADAGRGLERSASPDWHLLRAHLLLKLHRVPEARAEIARLGEDAKGPDALLLQSDIAVQTGSITNAFEFCLRSLKRHRTWDALARLAWLHALTGSVAQAEANYMAAEDELTAKEMRSYAWVEVQRGLLELNRGRFRQARSHYERADKAYSGYWLVESGLAELDAAEKQYPQAKARYERLIARTGKPEFEQALGDLLQFLGDRATARSYHEKALEGYLASAQAGEVHFLHHLASLYADSLDNGAEAVRWARRDVELRPNWQSRDTLAWSLFRNGEFKQARQTLEQALDATIPDPHLFSHAATIYRAAGEKALASRYQSKVAELNPKFAASFHGHR